MQKGQTMIMLIFFVLMALSITIAAIFIMTVTSSSTTDEQIGIETKELADSAGENAVLKLERDPTYTGEVYTVGAANITISVTGGATKIATASATENSFTRKVEIHMNYTNNVLSVSSWKEIN